MTGRVSPRRTRRGLQGASLASAIRGPARSHHSGAFHRRQFITRRRGQSDVPTFPGRFVAGVLLVGVGAVPGRAQEPPGGRPAGPALRVSEDGRYLVRDRATPFFWLGDTAWLLFQMTTRDDAELYLRTRAEQGFTVIQAAVVMGEERVGGTLRPNRYGDLAFRDGDPARPAVTDGSSPDDAAEYDYWDHADYLVGRARAHGLTLALLPLFVGHGGDGFKHLTPENAEAYGLFLGRRYGARPHVLWVLGGDNTPDTEAKRAVWARLARGLTIGAAGAEDYGRTADDLPHQRAELVVAVVPRGALAGLQHDPGLGRREGHLPEGRGGPGAGPGEADGAGRGLVRGRPPVPHAADRRPEGPPAGVLVLPGRGLPHLRQHEHLELRLVQAGGDAGLEGGPPLARGREPVGPGEAVHLAGVVGARPGPVDPRLRGRRRRGAERRDALGRRGPHPGLPARPGRRLAWTCARSPGPSPPSRPGSTPGPGHGRPRARSPRPVSARSRRRRDGRTRSCSSRRDGERRPRGPSRRSWTSPRRRFTDERWRRSDLQNGGSPRITPLVPRPTPDRPTAARAARRSPTDARRPAAGGCGTGAGPRGRQTGGRGRGDPGVPPG